MSATATRPKSEHSHYSKKLDVLLSLCDLCAARKLAWMMVQPFGPTRDGAARVIRSHRIGGYDGFLEREGYEPLGDAAGRTLPVVTKPKPRAVEPLPWHRRPREEWTPEQRAEAAQAANALFGPRRKQTAVVKPEPPAVRSCLHDLRADSCAPCSRCGKPAYFFTLHRAECPSCCQAYVDAGRPAR